MSRFELKDRSDQQLLTGAKQLVSRERLATAELIAHLGEIDSRRLFLEEGCSSLFKYCTQVLHLSESAAYHRIDVMRVARKFPVIFERLAEGSIHLSALRILGPCLTSQNHLTLLDAAKHQSKEEVERIAATVSPRPDVPSVIRKLPERGMSESQTGAGESGLFRGNSEETTAEPASLQAQAGSQAVSAVPGLPATPRRPTVAALSPGRYKVEFTADDETHQALRQLQELMRHQVPNGDVGAIMKEALLSLLKQVKREKLAQVKEPRKRKAEAGDLWGGEDARGSDANPKTNDGESKPAVGPSEGDGARESRHIPAEVKRSVWERDKGQCAFVGRNGRRCTERGRLEFHHVHAYALGGPATIDNIALCCRAHNAHESRLLFGQTNGKKASRSGASSVSPNGGNLTRGPNETMRNGGQTAP